MSTVYSAVLPPSLMVFLKLMLAGELDDDDDDNNDYNSKIHAVL